MLVSRNLTAACQVHPQQAMASKLSQYRAKRDFKKTKEPSGSASMRQADYPRFVIQKHDATRLHYDLRLVWTACSSRGP